MCVLVHARRERRGMAGGWVWCNVMLFHASSVTDMWIGRSCRAEERLEGGQGTPRVDSHGMVSMAPVGAWLPWAQMLGAGIWIVMLVSVVRKKGVMWMCCRSVLRRPYRLEYHLEFRLIMGHTYTRRPELGI